mgnify:CR=1 FL=1
MNLRKNLEGKNTVYLHVFTFYDFKQCARSHGTNTLRMAPSKIMMGLIEGGNYREQ